MGERNDDSGARSGLRFVGVGFSFGAYVAVGGYAAHLAQTHWGWPEFVMPLGIVLGATLGTWDLIKMVRHAERAERRNKGLDDEPK